MDEYSALVEQILRVPVLADRIQEWASEADSLNMVTTDWKQRLENSIVYTDFQGNAQHKFAPPRQCNAFRVQNVKDGPYRMIVVGMCNVYTPYSGAHNYKQPFAVNMYECEPLNMMGMAWTSDVDSSKVELANSTKLNFGTCGMCCRHCNTAHKDMQACGVRVQFDPNQPCILNMEIFNGEKLDYCFAPQVKSHFQSKFIAILNVAFNVRYFYPLKDSDKVERVRIGGKAYSMIAFPESNLMVSPKLSLSNLPVLTLTGEKGSAEDEEQIIDAVPRQHQLAQHPAVEETITFPTSLPVLGEKRPADDSDEEQVIDAVPRQKKFAKRDNPSGICVVEETITFD